MTLTELAQKLRSYIEKAAISLSDEDALDAVQLYPSWKNEHEYKTIGERVRYDGVLYKVLQPHTSQSAWTPPAAPSLFAKVLIPDPDVIPEWEQPDSTNPYQIGDKVQFEGKVYESVIANNVWAPNVYGWKEVL
jgi:hypothetical protein